MQLSVFVLLKERCVRVLRLEPESVSHTHRKWENYYKPIRIF
jgi:hypothetical protein